MKLGTKMTKQFFKELGFNGIKVNDYGYMSSNMIEKKVYIHTDLYKQDNSTNERLKVFFKKLYKSYGWKVEIQEATFSILHELGHILQSTRYKDLNATLEEYQKQVYDIETKYSSGKYSLEQAQAMYSNLPLERDADTMAYVLYQMFKEQVEKFDKEMYEKFAN